MIKDYEIQDSGNRREFETGAVRDIQENKGRFDLLPACAITRLAIHYDKGSKKYGDRNWEKGLPISSMIDSALRHVFKYIDGQTDEDHLVAAAWNLMGAMWMEEKKPEMQDIPSRLQKPIEMETSESYINVSNSQISNIDLSIKNPVEHRLVSQWTIADSNEKIVLGTRVVITNGNFKNKTGVVTKIISLGNDKQFYSVHLDERHTITVTADSIRMEL